MKASFSRNLLSRSSTLAILAMLGIADPAGAVDITITTENRPGVSNAGLLEFITISGSTINGNVTNLAGGTIDPNGGDGIYVTQSTVTGGVLNQGRIIDADSGVYVQSSSVGGSVANSGTIEAAYGLNVSTSVVQGSVINSGRIEASSTGIYVYDTTVGGNVANSGTIESVGWGIYVYTSEVQGAVVNNGIIDSTSSTGIYVSDSTIRGGISNAGTIDADNSYGIYVDGGLIENGIQNSGVIDSYYTGIYIYDVDTFAGGIQNSGTIESHTSGGIHVDSVDTFTGGISNSGTIRSEDTGIYVDNSEIFAGGIVNSGLIDADSGYGIYVSSIVSFSGGIANSGTIDSYYEGIYVSDGTVFEGGIQNSGVIEAESEGIYVSGILTFAGGIANSGTIESYYTGIYVYNVDSFAGGIANSGVIDSYTSMGIRVSDVISFTGGISNSGTIDTYYTGIYVYTVSTFAGGIVNSGWLDADDTGIYVTDVGSFGGGITNSGTLTTDYIAIRASDIDSFSGGIVNSGFLESESYGIYVADIGSFSGGMLNSGVLNSDSTAIYLSNTDTFTGGIVNSGVVNAYYQGIYIYTVDTFTGGISNSGTIRADYSYGIYVYTGDSFSGGVANSGLIESSYTGIYLYSISTFAGGVTNSGTIHSDDTGIYLYDIDTFTGGVSNSGVIASSDGGIMMSYVYTFSGGVSNSGTIDSDDSHGIYIYESDTFTGDIVNSGLIHAEYTGLIVYYVDTLFGSITNSGTIESWDSYGIYFADTDFMSGSVVNSGLIHSDYTGIYILSVDTLSGDITNSGTVLVGLDGSYGIYVSNTTVLGALVNTGLIDPPTGIYVANSSFAGGIRNSGTILADDYAINALGLGTGVDIFLDGGLVRGDIGLPTAGTGNVIASGGVMEGDIIGDGDDDLYVEGDFHIDGAVTLMDDVNVNGGTATFHGDVDGQTFTLADGARAIIGVDVDNDTGFTATFTNAWTANPNGTLAVEVAGAEGGSAAGQWIFGAGTTVGGNFQAVVLPDLYEDVTTYAGVVQTGGFAGSFANVGDTSAFLEAELVQNGNDFDLVLTRTAFNAAPGLGSNAQSLGNVLEGLYQDYLGGNPIDPDALPVIQQLFAGGGDDANSFLAQVAGSSHAQAGYVTQATMQQIFTALQNRMAGTRNYDPSTQGGAGGGSAERGQLAALASSDATAGLTQEAAGNSSSASNRQPNGFQVWGQGLAGFGTREGDDNAQGYDRDSYGGAVGLDYLLGETLVFGVAGHYLATNADFDGFGDELDVDSFGFSLYGSWQPGFLYVDLGGSVSFNSYESERNLPVGLGSEQFNADYDGTSWGVYLESGWRFEMGSFALTPSANVTYTSVSTEGFTETGTASGLALQSDGVDADSLTTTLMLRASTAFDLGGMVLVPELRAGWQHEFLDEPEMEANFVALPGSSFTVVGSEVASDSALVGASLNLGVMSNVEVFVDYDARFGGDDTSHAIGLGGRIGF